MVTLIWLPCHTSRQRSKKDNLACQPTEDRNNRLFSLSTDLNLRSRNLKRSLRAKKKRQRLTRTNNSNPQQFTFKPFRKAQKAIRNNHCHWHSTIKNLERLWGNRLSNRWIFCIFPKTSQWKIGRRVSWECSKSTIKNWELWGRKPGISRNSTNFISLLMHLSSEYLFKCAVSLRMNLEGAMGHWITNLDSRQYTLTLVTTKYRKLR